MSVNKTWAIRRTFDSKLFILVCKNLYKMERPNTVWSFTILSIIFILFSLFATYINYTDPEADKTTAMLSVFVYLLWAIPAVIMVVKLFMLKKSAILWVHLTFGINVVLGIIFLVLSFSTIDTVLIGISIFLWWAIINYIKSKQVSGKSLFT